MSWDSIIKAFSMIAVAIVLALMIGSFGVLISTREVNTPTETIDGFMWHDIDPPWPHLQCKALVWKNNLTVIGVYCEEELE